MATEPALFKVRASFELVKRDEEGNVIEVLNGEGEEHIVRALPDGTLEPVTDTNNSCQ